MAELPFIAEPTGDLAVVSAAAAQGAQRLGLAEPHLLRISMNGIFTAGDDVVLRVGRATADPRAVVELTEMLSSAGVRVPRCVAEPITVDGFAVVPIERIHPTGQPDWERVGAMVAAVHRLDPALVASIYPVPWCASFPWWQVGTMLCQVGADIDRYATRGLLAAIDEHLPRLAAAVDGPTVVAHGDVHTGNVLNDAAGPVLIDWDLLCRAPAAWDHAPLLRHAWPWGGDAGIYPAFAAGYGRNLAGDPLAESIAELRLVAATLMRCAAARTDPTAAAEAQQRLAYWRGDRAAPAWRAQ